MSNNTQIIEIPSQELNNTDEKQYYTKKEIINLTGINPNTLDNYFRDIVPKGDEKRSNAINGQIKEYSKDFIVSLFSLKNTNYLEPFTGQKSTNSQNLSNTNQNVTNQLRQRIRELEQDLKTQKSEYEDKLKNKDILMSGFDLIYRELLDANKRLDLRLQESIEFNKILNQTLSQSQQLQGDMQKQLKDALNFKNLLPEQVEKATKKKRWGIF